jgi:PAN domain
MKWLWFSRPLFLLGIAMVLGYSGVALAQSPALEFGVDRPGSDSFSFDMVRAEPTDCQAVCLLNLDCQAWTFVRPGFQSANARCWVKSQVPAPRDAPCCVSGVKQ